MRALIVDDDMAVSRLIWRCLSSLGWRADESHSASDAMGLFKQGHYDLILCDVDLPDGDGIDLAHAMSKAKPSLRIVIVSGDATNLNRAREGGLLDCLRKPFALNDLRTLVNSELVEAEGENTGKRATAMERHPPPNGPTHILLVEDDPDQLAAARDILEGLGYRVTVAESAEAALRHVELTHFDMILTDNILPGMTGFQSLPGLRASGSPVIVMSSQHDRDTEKDARLLGAAAFIKKPLAVKELSRLIKRALDRDLPSSNSPEQP